MAAIMNMSKVYILPCIIGLVGMSFALSAIDAVHHVTVSDLFKHHAKWDKKQVEVVGYYVSSFERHVLYERKFVYTNALWIDVLHVGTNQSAEIDWVPEGKVRVVGRFEWLPKGGGHMNAFRAKITDIQRFLPFEPRSSEGIAPAQPEPPTGKSDGKSRTISFETTSFFGK